MSKIVFWSPMHGQGQTSNLHIISLIMSQLHRKRTLIMQTHFSMNNLEGPLVGKNPNVNNYKETDIFQDIGIDAAVIYSGINKLADNILESCCITFPNTPLLLLPGTETKNRETFERDISSATCRMIEHAEDHVDIVMIDANSGNDELSFKLMSSADLVVVNLRQGKYVLKEFLFDYQDIIKQNNKMFFLFGNYDRNSGYNIVNCRRKHGKYINKNNSGVIPYSTKYMDALNESEIISMVREGLDSAKATDIYKIREIYKRIFSFEKGSLREMDYFFHQACISTSKIMDMISVKGKVPPVERGEL